MKYYEEGVEWRKEGREKRNEGVWRSLRCKLVLGKVESEGLKEEEE